jgi:hypothetical protein
MSPVYQNPESLGPEDEADEISRENELRTGDEDLEDELEDPDLVVNPDDPDEEYPRYAEGDIAAEARVEAAEGRQLPRDGTAIYE